MSAPKNSSHNLQVALKWQQAGLSIFVAGPDKKPRVKWRDVSTTDPDQIKEWFKQWPDASRYRSCQVRAHHSRW